jgi:AcrR family transcriptional regulator
VSKGNRTRTAILDTALAEVSTVGLAALSIGGLARKAKLSKSGLFAHFGSKEDLQLEVLATARARFVETVIAPALTLPRGEPRIRGLFESWIEWSKSSFLPGGCPFVSAANELDDQPGRLRDFLVQSQRDWLDTLATAARIAVDEGHLHAELDVEQFAYEFYSLILSYHHFHRLLEDPHTEERCRLAFEQLIERAASGPAGS